MHRRHCAGPDPVPPYLRNPDLRHTVFRRFLGARSWDLDRASRMLTRCLAWRAAHAIDALPFLPAPRGFSRGYDVSPSHPLYDRPLRDDPGMDAFLEELQKSYHGTWHYWDRDDNPVFIERTGESDPRGMVRTARAEALRRGTTFDAELLRGHLLSIELGGHLARLQTQRLERPIFQFTYILDLKGYRYSHLYQPIFTALKAIIENDKQNYPETTSHAFVVNAPGIVTVAWNILSPILDHRTRAKVHILGADYAGALTKVVDPARLPSFLGGECECPEGCVP